MNERKQTPLGLISALPVSPPDPVGSAVWHTAEENRGDLFIKGDRMISGVEKAEFSVTLQQFLQPLLKFRLPGISSLFLAREAEKGTEERTPREKSEEEAVEREAEEAEDIFIGSEKETAKLQI